MRIHWTKRTPEAVFGLAALLSGCETLRPTPIARRDQPPITIPADGEIRQAAFRTSESAPTLGLAEPESNNAFAGKTELSEAILVTEVLARNPSLSQMDAAWQAATARYPQVKAFDDPMFGAMIAPASIHSQNVEFGYRVEVSQKIPVPGKRRLRGENALAEANAAGNDVEDMRLQLTEAAKAAFADYFFVFRAVEVNQEGQRLLTDFRRNAESRYQTGQVPQQDILQADVEIGKQRERGLMLDRMREVAIARLNTLMHQLPDAPLPPPPRQLVMNVTLPLPAALRESALARRPDLEAVRYRIAADQANLGLAFKDFAPDADVTAAYDTIMGNGPMRDVAAQVGVRVNLPVLKNKRHAAVSEAQAKLNQRHAELARLTDQVNFEVQQAYAQVRESERIVHLYNKDLLPAAQANVKAAQSAYVTGKTPFLSLIEAQRNVVMLQDRAYEANADVSRRLATLERAIGGPIPAER